MGYNLWEWFMDGELSVYVLIEYDIINSVEFGCRNFLKYGFALL